MEYQEQVSWGPREQSCGVYTVLPKVPLGVTAVSLDWMGCHTSLQNQSNSAFELLIYWIGHKVYYIFSVK